MPIDLPAGVTWKGQTWATAEACVDGWHLDGFLDGRGREGWYPLDDDGEAAW
jgi:hypothetical protein